MGYLTFNARDVVYFKPSLVLLWLFKKLKNIDIARNLGPNVQFTGLVTMVQVLYFLEICCRG